MKGFKDKKGKFHPTGQHSGLKKSDIKTKQVRTKSALKKSDLQSRTRQKKDIPFKPERQGARVKILTGEFAGKEGVIANVSIFSDEFGVRVDDIDNEYQSSAEFLKPSDVEFLDKDPALRHKEIIGDDASDTGRLEDIFGDVSNDDLSINFKKLSGEAHDNIKYILEREKIIKKGDKVISHIVDYRDEEKGDSGYYASRFQVYRNDKEIYDGLAEGDISHGEMWDMELQVGKA